MPPFPARYCPRCATRLVRRDDHGSERPTCPECGFIHYRNPVPAAGCIVERDGRLLLAKRKHPPYQDHWYVPSGFVEYDEDVEATATREIFEETGLIVAVAGIFGAYSYFDDPRKNGIIILFRASVVGGALCPADDASEVGFFAADALPRPIAFASHRRALREWRARGEARGTAPTSP